MISFSSVSFRSPSKYTVHVQMVRGNSDWVLSISIRRGTAGIFDGHLRYKNKT